MSIESDLQAFIASEVVADGASGVGLEEPLVRSGRIDSMGLLQILGFVQQRYGVDLSATGGPSDFETVASLAAAIRRSRGDR
ncbi:MAG: acyl carrier protein [Candidatus Rokubacteria bacterium]|nr:acyl carrier protein [Candidatus Rokubacteria bacterium]